MNSFCLLRHRLWPWRRHSGDLVRWIEKGDGCIIHLPCLSCLLKEANQKKIGQVRNSLLYLKDQWNVLTILYSIIKVVSAASSTLKAPKDIKRATIIWDIQSKLCTTSTEQIKNYGRAVLNTVICYQRGWKKSKFAQAVHLN